MTMSARYCKQLQVREQYVYKCVHSNLHVDVGDVNLGFLSLEATGPAGWTQYFDYYDYSGFGKSTTSSTWTSLR